MGMHITADNIKKLIFVKALSLNISSFSIRGQNNEPSWYIKDVEILDYLSVILAFKQRLRSMDLVNLLYGV
jgi:hypothetical protein